MLRRGLEKDAFTIKGMYDYIMESSSVEGEMSFPWSKLWWKVISSKISTFSWKAVCERLPAKDNLMKRGLFEGLGTGAYLLCFSPLESLNHVLFSCSVALFIWQALSLWLDKPMLYSHQLLSILLSL